MIDTGIVSDFGRLIREAEERARGQMNEGQVEQEDDITARFFEAIQQIFERHGESHRYRFSARTLRSRGPNAPEKRFGADVCGALDIDIPGCRIRKGFLVQAKRANSQHIRVTREPYPSPLFSVDDEFRRLQKQCKRMLRVSPDSFVFVYSSSGFSVVPATSIAGIGRTNSPVEFYRKTVAGFFREFLKSFIGDHNITAHDDETMERAAQRWDCKQALLVSLKGPTPV